MHLDFPLQKPALALSNPVFFPSKHALSQPAHCIISFSHLTYANTTFSIAHDTLRQMVDLQADSW
jgi:hypothetical protein